jgi:hypothetical protein
VSVDGGAIASGSYRANESASQNESSAALLGWAKLSGRTTSGGRG